MSKQWRLTRRSVMKASVLGLAPAAVRPTTNLPSFVFLISDDHSVPDLGCYGNPAIRTPNLDRMAREGMRFVNCFVSSPQCSPNRSAILTGCTPHTTATSRLHTPMPDWEPTFLNPLKERGYFVGALRKVHQGKNFDKRWDFCDDSGQPFESFFDALPAGRPFFLQVGFRDPHRPYRPGAFSPAHDPAKVQVPSFLPDTPEVRADLAAYYDEIARMDAECGQVLEILNKRNLAENTLVIFTGDNGMPFPRAKGSCYDPGLHVPLLAHWSGKIKPGVVTKELISHVDLPVTWLDLAGVDKPKKMQGTSFLDLLQGKPHRSRKEIFAERNWHDNFDPIRAVRTDRHKLIFNAAPHFPYRPAWDLEGSPSWKSYLEMAQAGKLSPELRRLLEPARPMLELYDLEQDPGEVHNLATSAEHAGVLEDLKRRLSDWMHETYDFLPPPYRAHPASKRPGRTSDL
jgi:arylsulfatase A-like enzyme